MKRALFLISFLAKHLVVGLCVYKSYILLHINLFLRHKPAIVELYDGAKYRIRGGYFDIATLDQIYIEHVYDPPGFELRPDDVVVDIGAYIGDYSVYTARQIPQGKLYAFEPVKETFALLQSNVQINKLNNIFCKNYGLSDSNRNVEFRTGSVISQPGASAYDLDNMGYKTSNYKTSQVTLRDVNESIRELDIDRIDVLKIDCEGEEFALLYHLDRVKLSRCRLCMVEYHNIHKNRDYSGQKLTDFFSSLGFDVKIVPYYLAQNTGMIYAKKY